MNDLKRTMQRLCQLANARVTGDVAGADGHLCTGLKRVAQNQGGVWVESPDSVTPHEPDRCEQIKQQ